jgi:acetyl esterase/lipase
MNVEKGIVYAEREGFRPLELDLYRPGAPASGTADRRPLLVYVHGGGWRVSHRGLAPRETRAWQPGFFERLTAAGFVVASVEYRYSGEALFPAQIDDVVAGLGWLHAHAADLGADADRTFLWGASAGGHLAALAALVPAPPVAGVVCWYPITDLPALDRTATGSFEAHLLGGPIGERLDAARAASPVAHVHGGAPPFLLQHGDRDTMVPVDQSLVLAEALRAAGVAVEIDVVVGADHFFAGAPDAEPIFARALAFLLDLDLGLGPGAGPGGAAADGA